MTKNRYKSSMGKTQDKPSVVDPNGENAFDFLVPDSDQESEKDDSDAEDSN